MTQRIALTALALLCLVTAMARATDGKKVVVLGSSTAAGTGPAHPESAWVNRFRADALAGDSLRIVTNLALGGYTTYHIMPNGFVPPPGRPTPDGSRNITHAINLGADGVIINMPSNDQVNGYDLSETIANYDTVMAVAAAAGVQVWLSTTQPRNTTLDIRTALMAMRDSTFSIFGDRAIDFWTTIANPDGTINSLYDSGDGVHLNDRAHGILFARVAAKDIWSAIAPPPPVGVPTVLAAEGWHLYPAFPNPFRGETSLSYSVAAPTHVVLDLYDVQGRKIQTLEDRDAPAGMHRVALDGRSLASGVYFYRLQTSRGATVGKATLIH